jgi:predicted phage terminase large subunit-like protein
MNPIPNYTIDESILEKMFSDKKIRINITTESFWYFFHFYFAHYIKYATADFQKEIISILESDPTTSLYIVAFRGSGKSTIVTTAYLLWSILGKQQKKFCAVFGQTRGQAKQYMNNIKAELESNTLLRNDLGPFQEDSDEWGGYSIVFKQRSARITVASSEQSVRGLRHGSHRPDLIICDDVEDMQSAKTKEGRDKTYNWLRGEVIPLGDRNTRLVVVGNLLHEDSLLMRIRSEIEKEDTVGIFKAYPLINDTGICLWSGKYPTTNDLEFEKKKISNEVTWQREYLLTIVPDDGQVIYPEWIQYYKQEYLPTKSRNTLVFGYIGVDLAISQSSNADYTAIISAYLVIGDKGVQTIYILPNPINRRLGFPETSALCKSLLYEINRKTHRANILVEKIGYQDALVQQLKNEGMRDVEGVTPVGDKRTRLALTSNMIQSGSVLFPETGCEDLITQLTHFGSEKHDDLVDAFTIIINYIVSHPYIEPNLRLVSFNSFKTHQDDDGDF